MFEIVGNNSSILLSRILNHRQHRTHLSGTERHLAIKGHRSLENGPVGSKWKVTDGQA